MSTDTIATDVALCDAERRIAELRAESARIPIKCTEEQDAAWGRLYDQIADLDDMTLAAPVETLAGAACVLRRMLDPDCGVGVTDSHRTDGLFAVATQHVLAVVKREAAKGWAS